MFCFIRRSESHLSSAFRAITSLILVFKAMFCFVRRLESHLDFGVQSYIFIRRLEPCFASFRVRNHILVQRLEPYLHSAFRAMFCFIRRSESHLSFGVQSHHRRFSVLAFKAIIITFSVWHSESHFQLRHSEPPSSHFWFRSSEPSSSLFSFDI